jgi:hypothetical protein
MFVVLPTCCTHRQQPFHEGAARLAKEKEHTMSSHRAWLLLIMIAILPLFSRNSAVFAHTPFPPSPTSTKAITTKDRKGRNDHRDTSLAAIEQVDSFGGATYGLAVQDNTVYLGEGTNVTIVDVSDATKPDKLASLSFPSLVWDMHVEGSLLFVANGNTGGVQVVDVSTPASPKVMGNYDTPGVALRVDSVGNRAYVADSIGGMHILDVSTPAAPTLLGSYTDVVQVSGVQVDESNDTIAYVSDVSLGLLVIDVSTPAAPTLLGTYSGPHYSENLRVENNLVYMTHYIPDPFPPDPEDPHTPDDQIHIIDVSNPAMPQNVGIYTGLDSPENLFVENQMVYVADGLNGLQMVNTSNAAAPFLTGRYSSLGSATDIVVQGDRAYIASNEEGLLILDVSQPTVPTLLGVYNVMGWAWDVRVHDGHTYIATGHGMHIVDQDNNLVGAFSFPTKTPGMMLDIAVVGNTAYISTLDYDIETDEAASTLLIYDIITPTEPLLLGSYHPEEMINQIDVVGSMVYMEVMEMNEVALHIIDASDPAEPVLLTTYQPITDFHVDQTTVHLTSSNGLTVLDVSNPASPVVVGVNPLIIRGDLDVDDNKAYVASNYGLLSIFDVNPGSGNFLKLLGQYRLPNQLSQEFISDITAANGLVYLVSTTNFENAKLSIIDASVPSQPVLRGTYSSNDWLYYGVHVAVTGSYAYVSTGINRLDILDISNPTAPLLAGSYEPSPLSHYSPVNQVHIVGNQAFLAVGAKGFEILDISTASTPTYTGGLVNASKNSVGVYIEVDNDLVYLHGSHLDIINVQDPANPQHIAHYQAPCPGLFVKGSLLYTAEGQNGLRILDMSIPTHPKIIGHYDTGGFAFDVYIEDDLAYVADASGGLNILDVTNPAEIVFLGRYDTPGFASRLQVRYNIAYVVDAEAEIDGPTGLQIIDVSNPTNPQLLGSYDTPSEAQDVLLDGNTAYVSTFIDGLLFLDVSDPTTPTLTEQVKMPGVTLGIQKVSNTFHIANYQAGYQVFDYSPDPDDLVFEKTYLPLITR